MTTTTFIDPREDIWGIHVHQELRKQDFAKAIVIQQACADYLTQHGIKITDEGATKPGYGPHLEYMWELRIEEQADRALEALGLAMSFMAVNRFGLSAYIHPLRHDPDKVNDLHTEGLKNQGNTLWFGERVEQDQSFFSSPPLDSQGNIIDTRTSRLLSADEKQRLIEHGKQELTSLQFVDPSDAIINGFHIHVDVESNQLALSKQVFEAMMAYCMDINMPPTSTRIYAPKENGPHVHGGWEIKFERPDKKVMHDIGVAVGWLMCNRQGLPVFIHPVSWHEGDYQAEIHAHEKQCMFIDYLAPLDLDFFVPDAEKGVTS